MISTAEQIPFVRQILVHIQYRGTLVIPAYVYLTPWKRVPLGTLIVLQFV
jgi:hypothetical protein